MNTFKPLFIIAVLGLASVVVYTAISRSPDSERKPPHIEALGLPATDAPLVQMPGTPDIGTPFGTDTRPAQPAEAWVNPPHIPGGSPGISPGNEESPPVYPQASPYPAYASAGGAPPMDTSYADPPGASNAGVSSRRHNSPAPAYSASDYQDGVLPGVSVGGPLGGTTEAPPSDPPFRSDAARADADAPAWPSSQAAAGIAPPLGPPSDERFVENRPTAGPTAAPADPDPLDEAGRLRPDVEQAFQQMMDQVSQELDAGRWARAHQLLSRFYRTPELSPQQVRQVTELLDQLAGTVIYSQQSLLEPPYVVRPGDTLQSIADQYQVPPELIANINGIRDPRGVQPGQELKVVRGPFHAVVHLSDHELTMMLGSLYAGRFAISIGRDQPDLEGSYVVTGKNIGPTYRGPDGATFEERDPRNPLGSLWLGLGDRVGQAPRLGIHGTNDPQSIGRDAPRGNIGLDQRDIEDVFGILSVGSRVDIRR